MGFSTFFLIFIICSVAFCFWVVYLINKKPKKNKSDPSEYQKFDNLINEINNEYQNNLEWREKIQKKALELVSINLGKEDEIYKSLNDLEIQNLQDSFKFLKLIEEARDKYKENDKKIFSKEYKKVSGGEAKDKNYKNDSKDISEKIDYSWSEYQGEMTWYEANKKAKELGMRLPTPAELETAFDAEVTKSWKDNGIYWTSKDIPADRAYYFDIVNNKTDNDFKGYCHHVRYIRP